MDKSDNIEEKLSSIRKILEQEKIWPQNYIFKFIVLNQTDKVEATKALFHPRKAKISQKESSNGKYVSVTGVELMSTPDAIIQCYINAFKIEGLIAL